MNTDSARASRQWTYVTVSAAMALPVLVWPWMWMQQGGLHAGIPFPMLWMIAASSLLMCAVTADSMLGYRDERTSSILATSAWIIGMGIWVSSALRSESAPWLIAFGFLFHALRSTWQLWAGHERWWLWPAWLRDTGMASGIFLWLVALAHA